jgi:hypothetical protein
MANEIENAIYTFVAQKGEATMADIQEFVTANGINISDANMAIKRLLGTGRIYYIRAGTMVANPKKGTAPTQVQPGIKTNAWENKGLSRESWAEGGLGSGGSLGGSGWKRITL